MKRRSAIIAVTAIFIAVGGSIFYIFNRNNGEVIWKSYANHAGQYQIEYPSTQENAIRSQIEQQAAVGSAWYLSATHLELAELNISVLSGDPEYGSQTGQYHFASTSEELDRIAEIDLSKLRKSYASGTIEFIKKHRSFNGYDAVAIDSTSPIDSLIYHKLYLFYNNRVYIIFYNDRVNEKGELASYEEQKHILDSFRFISN